jgi:hypothetical protein
MPMKRCKGNRAGRQHESLVVIALVAVVLGLTLPGYQKLVTVLEKKGIDLPLWKHLLLFITAGLFAAAFLVVCWVLCFLFGLVCEGVLWIVSRFKK